MSFKNLTVDVFNCCCLAEVFEIFCMINLTELFILMLVLVTLTHSEGHKKESLKKAMSEICYSFECGSTECLVVCVFFLFFFFFFF